MKEGFVKKKDKFLRAVISYVKKAKLEIFSVEKIDLRRK